MKVFTFFYNRYENATTSKALYENGINHKILIHNEKDYQLFLKGSTIFGTPIITGNDKGLAYQRNSALAMMEKNEWAVFMCDDFKYIKSLPLNWITSNRKELPITFSNQNIFRINKHDKPTLREMFSLFPKLIELAENNGIHLIGFGLHDNPQNLKKKFTSRGLADGRFWLVKKSNYNFDTKAQLIDDVAWTAENLIRHKNVLVLNWLVPYFDRYTAGGFGTTVERKDLRKKECQYLVNKYNPLIKFANKPGWDVGTHIKIYATDNNIATVRKRNGML
jgi:hypothetical protein